MTSKRTSIGEASIETRLLYERLVQLQVDEVVTYQELNQICGGDTQREQRGKLTSAKNQAERDRPEILLDCVWGVGIKRIPPAAMNALMESGMRSVTRKTRKLLKRSSKVVLTDLPPQERAEFMARSSLLAVLSNLGNKKHLQQLEQKAAAEGNYLNEQKVLELFSQTKPQESEAEEKK